MSVIYCGKTNKVPYYIKEADLNVYSIQELAYFIYNYAMLISNNFINKNLIMFIERQLGKKALARVLNDKYNQNENLAEMLFCILEGSNYYDASELKTFQNTLLILIDYDEEKYINLAGDKLFGLKKYEKAIQKYQKIAGTNNEALKKLAYCYAKLQFFDKACEYLGELYKRVGDRDVLKDIYYCLKLNGNTDRIREYEANVDETTLAEWECNYVLILLEVQKSDEMKEKESIFLMGTDHIRSTVNDLVKIWKEKYRYIG